ncbi:hypothetical protein JNW88_15490 [Micromonospora sp. ATA32]|nr:hypothetical protein [Micromonospora sp. ATA32]
MGLIVGIDRFMSEARALTNFAGNAVATVLVGTWTGQFDRDRAAAVLRGDDPFDEVTMLDDDDEDTAPGRRPTRPTRTSGSPTRPVGCPPSAEAPRLSGRSTGGVGTAGRGPWIPGRIHGPQSPPGPRRDGRWLPATAPPSVTLRIGM